MNFVIIGGVSVNDATHDKYPYNFLDGGMKKGKSLTGSTTAIVYAPSYERRAKKQTNEHKTVTMSETCSTTQYRLMPKFAKYFIPIIPEKVSWESCEPNERHFLKVASGSAASKGMKYKEIRSAAELTTILKKAKDIESIYYFGHSNADDLFLEYSSIISSESRDTWGESEASKVPASNFKSGAIFVSYGCNQGDKGGLAEKLHDLWGITTTGSEGKTDFATIGQGKTHPSSSGGYHEYGSSGRQTVTITD